MLIGHTTYLITKIRGGSILVIFVGKPPPINLLFTCMYIMLKLIILASYSNN